MATCAHKIRNVLLTLQQAGVSGMLIVGSQRLNKGDRRQVFGVLRKKSVRDEFVNKSLRETLDCSH